MYGKDFQKVAYHHAYDDISEAKHHAKMLQKLYKDGVKVLVTTMEKFHAMTHPTAVSNQRI
jgi:hypothetical protein